MPDPRNDVEARSPAVSYVLRETLASKRQGKPLWFKQMTGIGPMTTPNQAEAAVYATKEAALRSPAMRHMLSSYEVEEASGASR